MTAEINSLLSRRKHEHRILLGGTAVVLTLDGFLIAASVMGESLTDRIRIFIAFAVIIMTLSWVIHAKSVSAFMRILTQKAHEAEHPLPPDERLYKDHLEKQPLRIPSHEFLAVQIPIGLIVCCVICALLWPSTEGRHADVSPVSRPSIAIESTAADQLPRWTDLASTIASGLAALIAVAAVFYTWKSAKYQAQQAILAALDSRFASLNQLKINNPAIWQWIEGQREQNSTTAESNAGPESAKHKQAARHLLFETFQFYQQVFLFKGRRTVGADDLQHWMDRLKHDLAQYYFYRVWWKDEQGVHPNRQSWDIAFYNEVNRLIKGHELDSNKVGDRLRSHATDS